MNNSTTNDIPQSLLGFESPPWYYYGSLAWEVYEDFDKVVVSSKKYPLTIIAFAVVIIELFLIIGWFYVKTNAGDNFRLLDFDIPNDPNAIALGLTVTGLVILFFALAALVWYHFDLCLWENPRFVFDKTANSLSFNNGDITYPTTDWQNACIVCISGFVHTPNMRSKRHGVEWLYLFVFDKNNEWKKHLIAITIHGRIPKSEIQKRIARLHVTTGFEVKQEPDA